jgi:hypothetical protein
MLWAFTSLDVTPPHSEKYDDQQRPTPQRNRNTSISEEQVQRMPGSQDGKTNGKERMISILYSSSPL